jgi:hypothetical protein
VGSPEGEPPEGMSVRRTPKYRNLHACKLSFYGNVGTYKNRRVSASHNTQGFFYWGRSLKVHREINKQLFTFLQTKITMTSLIPRAKTEDKLS